MIFFYFRLSFRSIDLKIFTAFPIICLFFNPKIDYIGLSSYCYIAQNNHLGFP